MIIENAAQEDVSDEYLEHCRGLMRESGWYVQAFMGPPAFCYTVGLAGVGIGATTDTELLICGLDVRAMFGLLHAIHRKCEEERLRVRAGMRLEGSELANVPLKLSLVSAQDAYSHMPLARRLLGRQPWALQVLWPDPKGVFPDEPGCEEPFASLQSLALLRTQGALQ